MIMEKKKTVSTLLFLVALIRTSICANVIENCLQSVNGVCQYCDNNLAMSSTKLSCVKTSIQNCIYIDEFNNCLECSCGYVVNFSQTSCIKLPIPIEGCRQVNYQNVCVQPKQYFMITPLGVTSNKESNCKKKSNSWLTPDCVECHVNFFLQNGRCVSLGQSNQSVGNSTVAYLVYNTTMQSVSISCHQNWYAYSIAGSQGCARTIDHCNAYSNFIPGICEQCIPGYFVGSLGSQCARATTEIDYCVEVNVSDLTKCIRCSSDEYKVLDGSCITRTSFVSNCILHTPSDDKCVQCAASFYLTSPTTCSPRSQIGCATVPISTDKCLSCTSGYFFASSTSTCTLRSYSNVNCLSYSSDSDSCAQCVKTFYLNAGACVARVISVTNCIVPEISADKCQICFSNAVRKPDGTCWIPLVTYQNCNAIDTSNNCNECSVGYGVMQNSSQCYDNFQNIPNCAKYSSGTTLTCESCLNSFILTTDKKMCLIPNGSCIQAAKPCNSFSSEGATLESYVCADIKNHSLILSPILLSFIIIFSTIFV